jgi:hypothetical protein
MALFRHFVPNATAGDAFHNLAKTTCSGHAGPNRPCYLLGSRAFKIVKAKKWKLSCPHSLTDFDLTDSGAIGVASTRVDGVDRESVIHIHTAIGVLPKALVAISLISYRSFRQKHLDWLRDLFVAIGFDPPIIVSRGNQLGICCV